jgi:hypothetical protein
MWRGGRLLSLIRGSWILSGVGEWKGRSEDEIKGWVGEVVSLLACLVPGIFASIPIRMCKFNHTIFLSCVLTSASTREQWKNGMPPCLIWRKEIEYMELWYGFTIGDRQTIPHRCTIFKGYRFLPGTSTANFFWGDQNLRPVHKWTAREDRLRIQSD